MAERNFPIQVVGVEYMCDECGIGTMEPHCGATAGLTERYPTVRHLRVETGKMTDKQLYIIRGTICLVGTLIANS